VANEIPGRSLTLALASAPESEELTFDFSVITGKRETTASIAVRNRVSHHDRAAARSAWRKRLESWLAECAAVLDGRRPFPAADELPENIWAACRRRRTAREMEESVSVTASTLVSASPGDTWQALCDPATQLAVDPDCVTAGQVPGTPVMRTGEVQYVIQRGDGGHLHAYVLAVDYTDDERAALVHAEINGFYAEILHQVEPDVEGARITLASRVLPPAIEALRNPSADAIWQSYKDSMIAEVANYKSFIEGQAIN
jgi:hypothetical protein